MLSLIVLTICFGLSQQQVELPHGHDLQVLIDSGFRAIDTNHDGLLSLDELTKIAVAEDTNGDGMISLQEYANFGGSSIDTVRPVFNAYDLDGDGLLPTDHMIDYLYMLDGNHDGRVTMKEYENYSFKFLNCAYGHHNGNFTEHGHAANCLDMTGHMLASGASCLNGICSIIFVISFNLLYFFFSIYVM
ncbi:hypothetical protein ACF0H5_021920 [Mactra antiquata]